LHCDLAKTESGSVDDLGGARFMDMADQVIEPPWLTLAEAAAHTGRHIDALRTMARRGKLERRKGNAGQWLVRLPSDDLARSDRRNDLRHDNDLTEVVAELREEVTELRVALARAEAGHDAALAQARTEGDARVAKAEAEAAAQRELGMELRKLLDDARRPWWRRWLTAPS
jgi:hypothetical protein